MKTQLKALTAAMGLGLVLASGSAMAESTYGYNATTPTTSNVTATAKLRITVNIPKLILLRVGSDGATVDDVVFTAVPNVQSAPGPLSIEGDSVAATWDGVAPTFAATTPNNPVNAYLWHNATGGATLSCAVSTPFTTGLTAADVTVSGTGTLTHPGTTTACSTPTTPLARNTLFTGVWTFGVNSAGMAAAAAGADFEVVTYTAVTL